MGAASAAVAHHGVVGGHGDERQRREALDRAVADVRKARRVWVALLLLALVVAVVAALVRLG